LELGVPKDKIRKNRAYKVGAPGEKVAAAEQPGTQAQEPKQAAAAEDQPTEGKEQKAKRLTWEEIMNDPEYKQEMSKMIRARLKESGQDSENHKAMAEANRALARHYGQDPENINYADLASAITGDDTLVEERAMRNGVDTNIQRKLDEFDILKAQNQRFTQEQAQKKLLADHYDSLKTQADAMKEAFPNFDLDKELATNREFARLTGPGVNVPVEKAYKLCHQDEIMMAATQAAQKQTAQKIANSIRSGTRRPEENGMADRAPSVSTFDYRNASKDQRAAFKKRIYEAGQRGEYIKPGQ
jgi:hypothetical protein